MSYICKMNRIKNISEVIIGEAEVLIEIINSKRESGILVNENLTDSHTHHYGIIVAKGSAVKDLEIGDIVVRTRIPEAPGYHYRGKDLLVFSRYNISIAVKPVNFDNNEELSA